MLFGKLLAGNCCKKNRGEQYFFVNNRFIKALILNHAVTNALGALLPKRQFSHVHFVYLISILRLLGINVHHHKQEIKFEDEKIIYAFVQSAVNAPGAI